jgi:hypothetical protein
MAPGGPWNWINRQQADYAQIIQAEPVFQKLHDPDYQPTPADMRMLESLYPDGFLDRPENRDLAQATLPMAGRALRLVDELYGPTAEHPKVHSGDAQTLPHTYHHGEHTRDVVRGSVSYAVKSQAADGPRRFSDRDLLLLPPAAAIHDLAFDYGRGLDEYRSAALAAEAMTASDYAFTDDDKYRVYRGIASTFYDEAARKHAVDKDSPPFDIAIGIGDLTSLTQPTGPAQGMSLVVEEFAKPGNRYGVDLHESLRRDGVDATGWSTQNYLDYIGQDKRLNQAFGTYMQGQAGFYAGHKYPDERVDLWLPGRPGNVAFNRQVAEKANDPDTPMKAGDAYREALAHSEDPDRHSHLEKRHGVYQAPLQASPGRHVAQEVDPGVLAALHGLDRPANISTADPSRLPTRHETPQQAPKRAPERDHSPDRAPGD